MAHFAQIDSNNIVVQVIVVPDEQEANGAEWCHNLLGGTWIQTSYNHRIRKQHAGVGHTYDPDADVFISPKPFPSWLLDENYNWNPPIPLPDDSYDYETDSGVAYLWDEESLSWLPIPDAE